MKKVISGQSVFGVKGSGTIPKTYFERSVDKQFSSYMKRVDNDRKHIIIYGSTQQGKTSLIRNYINKNSIDDYLEIKCGHDWTVYTVHVMLLKRLFKNSTIYVSEHSTSSAQRKVILEIDQKPLEKITREINANDINDVIELINNPPAESSTTIKKWIVLENFHFLSQIEQVKLVSTLRDIYESTNIRFIIIGMWLSTNRIGSLSNQLNGKYEEINIHIWELEDIKSVISKGEKELSVSFGALKEKIASMSQGSIYLAQRVCEEVCNNSDILTNTDFDENEVDIDTIIKEIVHNDYRYYFNILVGLIGRYKFETDEVIQLVISYILSAADTKELEEGIEFENIETYVRKRHSSSSQLSSLDIINKLASLYSLQVKNNPMAIILEYAVFEMKLKILERGFILWVTNQENREQLLTRLGID